VCQILLGGIAGFLDFVHLPVLQTQKNTTFRKVDLFPSSGEGRETSILLGLLERANINHWATYVSIITAV
jgi:hypothetical protein